jgi:hypothetical protein
MSEGDQNRPEMPKEFPGGKVIRAGMQAAGGAIPFLGGLLGAFAGAWCQFASNRDPHFASNRDPSGGDGLGLSA